MLTHVDPTHPSLSQLLAEHGTYLPTPYTLVAPLDAAFDAAVQTGDLACWRNDAVGARCAAAADVVGALNGADVLLGHGELVVSW